MGHFERNKFGAIDKKEARKKTNDVYGTRGEFGSFFSSFGNNHKHQRMNLCM